jgi:hypothetical protein
MKNERSSFSRKVDMQIKILPIIEMMHDSTIFLVEGFHGVKISVNDSLVRYKKRCDSPNQI